jgi:membrane protease YdiL (CAAX protease family)
VEGEAAGGWIPVGPAPAPAPAPTAPDALRPGTASILWSVLLGLDLALLGLSLLYAALDVLTGKGQALTGGPGLRTVLWAQVAFNLLTLGLIPLAWVVGTRARPWEGAVRYLHLEHPARGAAQGVLWGVASVAALVVLGSVLRRVGYDPPNAQADAILSAVTPALALALAFSAAVGEEIFFRGLMQRWLGVGGQALLFGLFHLSYATPLQVVIPALLGLGFGVLVRRGAPLWTTMVAHFLYDGVQLLSKFLPHGP